MIWNTELQRLEFDDGTPVGPRPLNDARREHGYPGDTAHLLATAESVERSESTYSMGKKTIKKLLKLSHDNIARSRKNRHSLPGGGGSGVNADYVVPGVYIADTYYSED